MLGVFEDRTQSRLLRGILGAAFESRQLVVSMDSVLTRGCRFDPLAELLSLAGGYDGVVVGVDGKAKSRAVKIGAMTKALGKRGLDTGRLDELGIPLLWSVARPSVEEWLLGDPEALPSVLSELFEGVPNRAARRPGRATGSETRAKQALDGWVEALLGEPVLRGGVAYAEEVGAAISPARVSKRRNPDLHAFLHEHLPAWLDALTAREA